MHPRLKKCLQIKAKNIYSNLLTGSFYCCSVKKIGPPSKLKSFARKEQGSRVTFARKEQGAGRRVKWTGRRIFNGASTEYSLEYY